MSAALLLNDAELAAFTARLSSTGEAAPVERVIADAEARVSLYVGSRTVAAAGLQRLAAALALHELHALCGKVIPDGVKARYDGAIRELEGLRDGKFSAGGGAGAGACGARPRARFGGGA